MDKKQNNLLTSNQFTFLLVGFVLGPGILRLPNALIEIGKQDSWISAIIGLALPLYIVLLGAYMCNKHPKENILVLSKKYFGNILGNILNFLFILQYIFYTVNITLDFTKLSKIYIVSFIKPKDIYIVTIALVAFICYKGLKTISRIAEIVGLLSIMIFLFSFAALKYGNILNVKPIGGAGLMNILKSGKETTYFYQGFEAIFLFYPFIQNTKNVKKAGINAVLICGAIWVWAVFITIYYLGIDIVPRNTYSVIMIYESIHILIINNFRFIVMATWVLSSFRVISCNYFSILFILNDIYKKDIKKLSIYFYPIIVFLCIQGPKTIFKKQYNNIMSPILLIYSIIFISVIAFIVYVKSKQQEKKVS